MSRNKTEKKLKKYKFRISTLLGKMFPIFVLIFVVIYDIIFLTKFEYDFENALMLGLLSIATVPSVIYFLEYFVCLVKYFDHDWKIRNSRLVSQARGGAPGSGKSSSMYNDGIIYAEMAWRRICYEYFLIQNNLFPHKESRSYAWDKRAIKECYNYFKKHPEYIPCLYSKDTIYDGRGRKTQKLTLAHLESKRKLHYRSVLLYDEIGKDLPAMTKFMDEANKDVNLKDIADFMRYLRHYGNFKIIFTEQDVKNMYIGNRRVTDENLLFIEQKTILRPKIFDLIQYFNIWAIGTITMTSKYISTALSKFIGKLFIAFDNFVSYVGFRKFVYVSLGNIDKSLVSEKKGSFILMPHLNCNYDDRANKYDYKAADNDYSVDNDCLNIQITDTEERTVGFVRD